MTRQEFLNELENMMALPPMSLTGKDDLASLPQWDSMQVLSFIVLVEEKLGLVVNGPDVGKSTTVDDLLLLVQARLND